MPGKGLVDDGSHPDLASIRPRKPPVSATKILWGQITVVLLIVLLDMGGDAVDSMAIRLSA
jgi:hypothetical protein